MAVRRSPAFSVTAIPRRGIVSDHLSAGSGPGCWCRARSSPFGCFIPAPDQPADCAHGVFVSKPLPVRPMQDAGSVADRSFRHGGGGGPSPFFAHRGDDELGASLDAPRFAYRLPDDELSFGRYLDGNHGNLPGETQSKAMITWPWPRGH